MPPKPRFLPMPRDEQVLDARNQAVEEWLGYAGSKQVYVKVQEFITSLRLKNERSTRMHPLIKGGYNLVYRLEYEDGRSIIMRVPIKDLVPFPDEKIIYEVSTMQYVAANTSIPVPYVYCHGNSVNNPTGLGPFIIMDYVDHSTNMSRELLDASRPVDSRPVLDPRISEAKLEVLYGEMAKILLQLHTLGPFSKIGSLVEAGKSTEGSAPRANVTGRPLMVNMIDLMTDTDAPQDVLPAPDRVFQSAKEWYTSLASIHMAQLVFQQGDCVEDSGDARDKFVARKLFDSLAASERLFSPWDGDNICTDHHPDTHTSTASAQAPRNSSFRLFSEDLRPANVLLDKNLNVVGVIDWEFVYSAPAEFSQDPPWWLLLSQPEDYPGGIFSWIMEYDKRLDVFLRVFERAEQKSDGEKGPKDGPVPTKTRARKKRRRGNKKAETKAPPTSGPLLSQQMRKSWDTGRWMVNYAARKSWMFDLMWWRFLDGVYFGPNEDQDSKVRVAMLPREEIDLMEEFVTRKIQEQAASQGGPGGRT
ncbi:hypothetical protein V8F20_010840 [Naviculisporaceae sp. PSN 640]